MFFARWRTMRDLSACSACDEQKHRGMNGTRGEMDGFFNTIRRCSVPVAVPRSYPPLFLTCSTNSGKRTNGLQGGRPSPRVPPPILFIANPDNLFGAGHLRIGRLGIYLPHFLSSTHLSAARSATRPSKSARNKP